MSLAGDTANPDLGIIQDALPLGATLPFTDAEWQELLELLASIDPADLRMCELIPGDLDRLPAALELRRCLDELDDLRARLADADGAVNDWELLDEAGPQALADLTASLVDAADWRRKIAGSWLDTVRRECAAKVGRQEWAAFTDCVSAERDELVDMRMALAPWQVSVPEGDDRVEASLHDARERLAAGKGISRLRHSAASGALDACMVDGRRPSCAEQVDACLLALQRDRSRRQLDARWANTVRRVGGPPLDPRRLPEDAVAEHLDAIRVALRWKKQAWPRLDGQLGDLGLRSRPDPTIEDLDSLLGAAAVLGLRVRERGLSAEVDAIGDYLGERAQVGESSLWAQLGDAFARRSWHLWDALVAEARRLADLQSGAIRLVSLRGRLAKGAPVFERHLAATRGVGAPTWEQLRLGWQWRQLEGALSLATSGPSPADLQRSLEELAARRLRQMEDLVAARAWQGLVDGFDDAKRGALNKYLTAVKRFGKTGGKYKDRWLREQREALDEAKAAVPIWVMTVDRGVVRGTGPASLSPVGDH